MELTRALADDNGHDFVWPPDHREKYEATESRELNDAELLSLSTSIDDLLASSRSQHVVCLAPTTMQFHPIAQPMELQQQAQTFAQ